MSTAAPSNEKQTLGGAGSSRVGSARAQVLEARRLVARSGYEEALDLLEQAQRAATAEADTSTLGEIGTVAQLISIQTTGPVRRRAVRLHHRQSWLGWAGGGILAAAFAGLAWMGISVVSADSGCVGGWRLRTAPYVFALGWTIGLWAVCGLVARRSTTVGAVALGVGVVLTLIVFYTGIAPAVWGHPDCTPHDEWWGW